MEEKNIDKLVGDAIAKVAYQQSVVSVRQIDALIEMTKQQELYHKQQKEKKEKNASRNRRDSGVEPI